MSGLDGLARLGISVAQNQSGIFVDQRIADTLVDYHQHQITILKSEPETLGQEFIRLASLCPHKNHFFMATLQYLENSAQ